MKPRDRMARRVGQSWREYVASASGKWEAEVLLDFDTQVANGIPEKDAAGYALCAWRRVPCAAS